MSESTGILASAAGYASLTSRRGCPSAPNGPSGLLEQTFALDYCQKFELRLGFDPLTAEADPQECSVAANAALLEQTGPLGSFAIAATTAVLRDVLANGLIRYSSVTRLGDVNVTALPPDRVTVGADEPNQVNLFMYRVSPHSKLRSVSPQGAGAGRERERQSLPLDLHYLITAYGAQDFHSEILLGCAVHLLNTTPVLTADIVRDALGQPVGKGHRGPMSPAREALAVSAALHVDARLRVSQEFLSFEEMSKLWSVLQARYRPSVTYEVSAVQMPLEG
jgi:hypothetical protein